MFSMPSPSPTSSPSITSQRQSPNVLTYSLDNKMVYVTPAEDYEQALDFAYSVFPTELHSIPRSRVYFSVNIVVRGSPRTSRISPMAWSAVIMTLKQYEIVLVSVLPPEHTNTDAMNNSYANIDSIPPPTYSPSSSRHILPSDNKHHDSSLLYPIKSSETRSRSSSPSSTSAHKKSGPLAWIDKMF